jgi:NTP pyrophosphatase (non-canonical NTP hydrolase)
MSEPLTTADCIRFNIPFDDAHRWWWDDEGYLCEAAYHEAALKTLIQSNKSHRKFRHRNTGPQPKLIPMIEQPPYGPALALLEAEILNCEPMEDDLPAIKLTLAARQRQLTNAHTLLSSAHIGGFGALVSLVRQWGADKGIIGDHAKATVQTQFDKLLEEVEELNVGISTSNHEETRDAIGDCTVVLILLAELAGTRFEECLHEAYEVISRRTGVMLDGKFIKDQ